MRFIALVATLTLGGIACQRERAEAAIDTTTMAFDTGLAVDRPARDSAEPDKAAPPPPVTPDGKALGAFIAASQHEIQHGRLAMENGSTQEVRDLGRTISRDHDDFVQRARQLGQRLGIISASQASDTSFQGHPSAMSDLRGNSGSAFDRVFLEHEIDYHRWLIDAVNTTMLPDATNEELRTFLRQALPAFESHMKGAQDLLAKASGQ